MPSIPRPADLQSPARVALALAVGAIGGVAFDLVGAPLAYMLGALAATMVASFAGAPLESSPKLRAVFLAIIGLFLGESFSADLAGRAAEWPITLALALAYPVVAGVFGYFAFRRMAGLEPLTAIYAGVPGGLSAAVAISGAVGADERAVALAHSLRVALVVMAAPAIFFWALGYRPEPHHAAAEIVGWGEAALLIGASAVGIVVFQALRGPMPWLLAPLVASGALRVGGWVEGDLPEPVVEVALVVVGASIGARFANVPGAAILKVAGATVVATILLCVVAGAFGLIASAVSGTPIVTALLAFSPGGIAEMALIAIAIDADPAFVAAHHLARIGFIVTLMPFLGHALPSSARE